MSVRMSSYDGNRTAKREKKKNVIAEKIKLGKKKWPAKVGSTHAYTYPDVIIIM